jgi:hypothetical protein
MESITCSQLCETSYIGHILRCLNEFSNELAVKQNHLTRHVTSLLLYTWSYWLTQWHATAAVKVTETKVSIMPVGEVLQKVLQLQTKKKLHNAVLRRPVARHLFPLPYPLCHMQTCVKILKCTIFRILKLFFTSLMHYLFWPIRFIGDVKNNLKFESEY